MAANVNGERVFGQEFVLTGVGVQEKCVDVLETDVDSQKCWFESLGSL
jgi:hypothetical protein